MESASDKRCKEIAARMWGVGGEAIEPLSGGTTNENYKVRLPDGRCYVVRIFGERTELLLVDRSGEEAATRMAASLGLGAAIVAKLPDEGALVLEFLAGDPIPTEMFAEPETLRRIVDAIRLLHEGPPLPTVLDPFDAAETYFRTAQGYGVSEQQTRDYLWAHSIAERIREAVDFRISCPCHCDFLPGNFLDDGQDIRIVDWEYAAMSDPRFDLGNFSINQEFTIEDDRRLVEYYYGERDETKVAAVRLLRFVSAFREAIWGYVQEHLSKVEFDYVAKNREYFRRMRATAEGPEFGHCFELLNRDHESRRGS